MPNCLALLPTRVSAWPGDAPVANTTVAADKTQKCLRKSMLILPDGFAVILVSVSSSTSRSRGKQRSAFGSSFMSDLVSRIETALAERFGERFHADAAISCLVGLV